MPVDISDILIFIKAIKEHSKYDFNDYSIKSFSRRVEKVLMDNKLDIYSLINKIKVDEEFLEQVVKDITVNTTELFRDPQTWHVLKYRILPKLRDKKTINIWHAGCSNGLEVYSMQILLQEMGIYDQTNLYATDINSNVLDIAQKGVYVYRFNIEYLDNFDKVIKENPYNFDEYNPVPYSRYFAIDKVKDTITMKPYLRNKPKFEKHDLISEENPFDVKYDLILCRNVLIYFNHELQNRIFDFFHGELTNKGNLILGIHESILGPQAAKYIKKGLVYAKKTL